MRVLVVNSGSSSVKIRLFELGKDSPKQTDQPHSVLATGAVTGIGSTASLKLRAGNGPPLTQQLSAADHRAAIDALLAALANSSIAAGEARPDALVDAVGHRVVHGGPHFSAPVLIDGEVMAEIDALGELAPLHNPAGLAGIRAARQALDSRVPMVAVFDTAFHRGLPEKAKHYALPGDLVERHGIQRYGFHGIAHASLLDIYLRASGHTPGDSRVITFQLGNGCSAAAIDRGRSVDTSMGFTPLEGLVMGTRSGDLDPSIVSYLCEKEGASPDEIERQLNQESGLLGVSGRSNDMRELLAAVTREQHPASMLAVELFCYRARKYLGSYLAALGGADAIVFGGGIGENAPAIRQAICDNMAWCGLVLDADRNDAATGLAPGQAARISADGAGIEAWVAGTDEESWIARETRRCLESDAAAD